MKKAILFTVASLFAMNAQAGSYDQGSLQNSSNQGMDNSFNQGQRSNINHNNPYNQSQGNYNQPQGYNSNSSQGRTNYSNRQGYTAEAGNGSYDQSTPVQNSQGVWGQSQNRSTNDSDSFDRNSNTSAAYDSSKEPNSKYQFPQDRFASDSDRILNMKIREKLTGWFTDKYKNIALNTNNGAVSVTGFVATEDDLKNLPGYLNKVDGVKSVNVNVQVKRS